jgi:hypothetical protein
LVDDGEDTVAETFVLDVTEINDPPSITSIADQVTFENTPTGAIPFTIRDIETPADQLGLTAVSFNTALVPSDQVVLGGTGEQRTVTITPSPDRSGEGIIALIVADQTGAIQTVTFKLMVESVGDPPAVVNPVGQVTVREDAEDSVFDLSQVFTDPDLEAGGDGLSFSIVENSNRDLVSTAFSGSTLTLDYAPHQFGTATIVVRATDRTNLFAEDTISLTVTPVNDEPTVSNMTDQTIDEDTSTSVSFTVADVETAADALVVTVTSDNQQLVPPAGLQLGGSGGERILTVIPAQDQAGAATVTVQVSDADGAVARETFRLTVAPVNDGPVHSVPGRQQTSVGVPVRFAADRGNPISVSDVDAADSNLGMILTVSAGSLSLATTEGLTTVQGDGTSGLTMSGPLIALNEALDGLVFTPPAGLTGTVTLTSVVNDLGHTGSGGELGDTERVEITIAAQPLTVEIVRVSPDVRAGAVEQISIVFSAPVRNFDLQDLSLRRFSDESVPLLSGPATLTSADDTTWILGNLADLTAGSGIYLLSLEASGADIQDQDGAPLVQGATARWVNGAGDADENGRFDQRDLVTVLQANLYLTGQAATWSQGDWNGDGVFNSLDIVLAGQTQPPHYLQGPFAARVLAGSQATGSPAGTPAGPGPGQCELDALDATFARLGSVG